MKRIIQKAKELIAEIEKNVEARNKFYDSRAGHWLLSKKGAEYRETTDRLSEMLNNLNDVVCELNEND